MKRDNFIYGIGTVIIVGCVIVIIGHLPGAEVASVLLKFTFIAEFFYMSLQNSKMRKRIKELGG